MLCASSQGLISLTAVVCLTFFAAFLVSAFTAAAWFFLVAFATAGAAFFAMMRDTVSDKVARQSICAMSQLFSSCSRAALPARPLLKLTVYY